MKTNYLLKSNRRKSKSLRPLFAALVIMLLAAAVYSLSPGLQGRAVFALARPIWSAREFLLGKLSAISLIFRVKETLQAENSALRAELEEARISLAPLDALRGELGELKKILGRGEPEKRILAAVLAGPGDSLYDTLVIDAGERQGVSKGKKVLVGDFLLGAADEVSADYSKVELFSSPGKKVSGRIGDSGVKVEAEGRGGGNFFARLPIAVKVKEGDLLKLAGVSDKFFAVVQSVDFEPTDTFQDILFSLPVNIYTLERVEVLK